MSEATDGRQLNAQGFAPIDKGRVEAAVRELLQNRRQTRDAAGGQAFGDHEHVDRKRRDGTAQNHKRQIPHELGLQHPFEIDAPYRPYCHSSPFHKTARPAFGTRRASYRL